MVKPPSVHQKQAMQEMSKEEAYAILENVKRGQAYPLSKVRLANAALIGHIRTERTRREPHE